MLCGNCFYTVTLQCHFYHQSSDVVISCIFWTVRGLWPVEGRSFDVEMILDVGLDQFSHRLVPVNVLVALIA